MAASRTPRDRGVHRRLSTPRHRTHRPAQPISFDSLAKEPRVSRSWLYNQPDLRAGIERLRTDQAGGFLSGNAPRTPHYSDVWSPRPNASGDWRTRTTSCERRSHWPSESTGPPPLHSTTTTRRERNPQRSSVPADHHVNATDFIESALVRALLNSSAQDKHSVGHAAVTGIAEPMPVEPRSPVLRSR